MKEKNGVVILKEFDNNDEYYCWIMNVRGDTAQEMINEVLEDYPLDGQIVDVGLFDVGEKFYDCGWVLKCDSRQLDYYKLARVVRRGRDRIEEELRKEIKRQYDTAAAEYAEEIRKVEGDKDDC